MIQRHDQTYTMLTIENQDWSMVTDVVEKYLDEVREVVNATRGHADLITQTVTHAKPDETAERLSQRIGGFTHIIDIHMFRLYALTDLIERLELIRTGKINEVVNQTWRRIVVAEFMEDFLEALDETPLLDPESETGDNRSRVRDGHPAERSPSTSHRATCHKSCETCCAMLSCTVCGRRWSRSSPTPTGATPFRLT